MEQKITYLKGVGAARTSVLQKELSIFTYHDLMHFFPFRYIDKTRYFKIKELLNNQSEVQIIGRITHLNKIQQKNGTRLIAKFSDGTGVIDLIWFRPNKWLLESLQMQKEYVCYGKLNFYNGNFSIAHPELELTEEHKRTIRIAMQAVYPSTELLQRKSITSRSFSKMLAQLFFEVKGTINETLSKDIIQKLSLISKEDALYNIHFPTSQEALTKAQFRLKFEELFFIQLQLVRKNLVSKTKIKSYTFGKVGHYFNRFYKHNLPFELTNAQKRVLKEIRNDVNTGAQMNRLLQGDVGSGKTIVALLSMLIALDNDFQATLIAPTTILAEQHYNSLLALTEGTNISIKLLIGSSKTKARREIHEILESGKLQILIGTHAILEDKVVFKNLGLVIIDEQHRFGVAQRAKMWKKNDFPPHVLVMTATPIPRTLAMSVYGDLDISMIDELPAGRKPIKTLHKYDSNRLALFKFMRDEIAKGRQIYIVYPLIQESETMDYKDLMDGYESIVRDFPLPEYQISIVHGKMKPEDKAFEMDRFVKGKTQIMVATTVIEVGVNVPNASVMIIESAERFGLSQLHQLRGRVGRGSEQSYCLLMSSYKLSKEAKTRLETMVQTNDGFKIAEVDLQLRGPGNLLGTQQSGILNLNIADIVKDNQLLELARKAAVYILKKDLNFELPENLPIKKAYVKIAKDQSLWSNIS